MNQKNTRLFVYCLIAGCILVTGITALSASAAESVFQITGKVIVEGDEGDMPLGGAIVNAIKYSSDDLIEILAASDTSAADGGYTLDVPVDSDLGAGDEYNKVQLRLSGPDDSYVTVCSPFLELLYFPQGFFTDYELIAQTVAAADAVLTEIDTIGGDYVINTGRGILVAIVEYEDGDDITGLAGVQFTPTSYPDGGAIEGVQMVYQAADGSWNAQTDRTTIHGVAVIYNIPLLETGWRDITLTPTQVDGYRIAPYPWTRVYAYDYSGNEKRLTFAEHLAEEAISPEEESTSDDDGDGGGCFITTAMP